MKNRNMKMITKKVTAFSLILSLTLTGLTGCKLAEDNEKAEKLASMDEKEDVIYEDLYVGTFFTTEDLFYDTDLDFTDEEMLDMVNGKEVEIYKPKVEGDKIYATKKEMTAEDGTTYEGYIFEGCDGVAAFYYYVDKEDGTAYKVLGDDSMVGPVDMEVQFCKDEKSESNTLDVTVYLDRFAAERENKKEVYDGVLVNYYDVYQTVTGEIYLTASDAMYIRGREHTSRNATVTNNISGKELSHTTDLSIEFKVITPADKTKLHMMNANKEIIDTVEIDNADISESITVGKETELIVIEKYYKGELVERTCKDLTQKKNQIHAEEATEPVGIIKLPMYGDKGMFVSVAEVTIEIK